MKRIYQLAAETHYKRYQNSRFIYQGNRPTRAPQVEPDPAEALAALALDETQTALNEQALNIALGRWARQSQEILTDINNDLSASEIFTVNEHGSIVIAVERALGINATRPVITAGQLNDLGLDPQTAVTYFAAHIDEFRNLDDPVNTGALTVDEEPDGNDTGALVPESVVPKDGALVQDPDTGAWVAPEALAGGIENFANAVDVAAINQVLEATGDIEERVVGVDYDALGNTYLVNLNGEAPLIIPATEVGTLEALTAAIYDNLGMDEGEAAEVVAAATAPTLEAIGAAYAAAANKGGILTQVNEAMGYVRGTADRITRFAQIQDRLAADPALRMAFGAALGLISEAPVVANPDPAEADPVASETAPAEGLNAESVEVPASYDIKASEREVVRGAQNLLNRAGFNAGGADGLVGPRTLGALRNAQEAAGLNPESTIVTPALVAFLNNKIQQAERATYVAREIEQNRSDRDFIRSVQMLIKPAEAPDSWADGSWGRLSRAALNEADVSVLDAVQALVETQAVTAHLETARQALGAERAAEIDALIENGASIDELAALTSPDATGGMGNRNLVAQYLQAKYEADGTDFSELAVAIMAQYECPEDWTVRQALHPAQNGNDEAYFRQFRRNGRESYYRIGYRVKQNELVQSVENSAASLTVAEAYNEENNTITIGDQVVALPSNARLHMTTGNEAGRADGWMDMTLLQAGNFELSHVVYDEPSGAIYFTMNNGCHGNPGVITVEQGLIPLPPAPRPGVTPDPEVDPEPDPELHTREECHNGNWSLRQWRGPFGPVTWTTLIPNDPRCNIGGDGGGGGGGKKGGDPGSDSERE